jgi:hypothetical protein
MPGGGRLDAGPSCFLALGEEGEFALLEGAVTATAGPGKPEGGTPGRLVVEAPGIVASTGGEIEVSVRTPSGARSRAGAEWLGAWAGARAKDAPAGAPIPEAPAAAVIVFARKGPVEVAGSPGPVRNQLERQVVPEGQALVLLESRVYRVLAVEENPPPESAAWTEGMPVPPDSRFLRRGAPDGTAPAPAPGGVGASPGPVRNTLERLEGSREARERAYALSLHEGIGGVEAVEAALRAVDDAAVIVRSAAVRVLALNAWADRPRALEALRRLARDPDAGVARFAILALKTLDDRDAIPVLQGIVVDDDAPPEKPVGPAVVDDDAPPEKPVGPAVVDDDAPPEKPVGPAMVDVVTPHGPSVVARVYAFDALVHFGDISTVTQAAALEPRVAEDEVLLRVLRGAVTRAFQLLDREVIRGHVNSEFPGVRAAALRALQDVSLAAPALQDSSEIVRLAAVEVHLLGPGAVGFGDWAPTLEGSDRYRARLVELMVDRTVAHPEEALPDWVGIPCRALLSSDQVASSEAIAAVDLLVRLGATDYLRSRSFAESSAAYDAMLSKGPVTTAQVVAALSSSAPDDRLSAMERLAKFTLLPEDQAPTAALLEGAIEFVPRGDREALLKANALLRIARDRSHEPAVDALLAMANGSTPEDRRNAFFSLSFLSDRAEVARMIVDRLGDPDSAAAFAAARCILFASRPGGAKWAGPAFESLFPSASPHAPVRAAMALVAHSRGDPAGGVALLEALRSCSSSERLRVFDLFAFTEARLPVADPDLLGDPSPRVRLQTLHFLEASERLRAAALFRDDPATWVRAAALAYLSESGDTAAEQALRALATDGLPVAGVGAASVPGLGPASPNLGSMVIAVSRVLASSSSLVEQHLTTRTGIRSDGVLLADAGTLSHCSRLLQTSGDTPSLLRAVTTLGESRLSAALSAVAPWTARRETVSASVREAAKRSASWLIGYTPHEGAPAFLGAHRPGIVTSAEILATKED